MLFILFTSLQFFGFKWISFRYTHLLATVLQKFHFVMHLKAFTDTNLIKSSSSDSRVSWFKHTDSQAPILSLLQITAKGRSRYGSWEGSHIGTLTMEGGGGSLKRWLIQTF